MQPLPPLGPVPPLTVFHCVEQEAITAGLSVSVFLALLASTKIRLDRPPVETAPWDRRRRGQGQAAKTSVEICVSSVMSCPVMVHAGLAQLDRIVKHTMFLSAGPARMVGPQLVPGPALSAPAQLWCASQASTILPATSVRLAFTARINPLAAQTPAFSAAPVSPLSRRGLAPRPSA